MTLPFHPLANLFPLIEGKDFDELVADVRANGLRERIVILDGQVLDGRNRYRAGIEAGLIDSDAPAHDGIGMQKWSVAYLPEYEGEPLPWVLSKNLHRRHLSTSQRAMIAAEIESFQHGGDRKGQDQDAKLRLDRTQAAERMRVSPRNVADAAKVRRDAAPEIVDAVKRGDVAVSAAAEVAKLPVAEQLEILRSADPKAFARVAKERRAEVQADKRERRDGREAELAARQAALPERRYGVIYADPEWRFEPFSRDSGMDRAADNHYPTSSLEAIKARPVADIAADDCVLFLWATVPMLPQALEVMAAWGFGYKSHFVWLKPEAGTGYWNRNQHELLLVGVRGSVPAPAPGTQWRSALAAPTGEHSEKPVFGYELIEDHFPNLPKIELNARRARPGWDGWGLEAPEEESHANADADAEAPGADAESVSRLAVGRTTAAGEAAPSASPASLPGDLYAAALAAALAATPVGSFGKATAEPALRAAYAADPVIPTKRVAADLGAPVGSVLGWASRLGLTRADRRGGPNHIGARRPETGGQS